MISKTRHWIVRVAVCVLPAIPFLVERNSAAQGSSTVLSQILPGFSEALIRLKTPGSLSGVLSTFGLVELLGTPRLRAHGWIRVRVPAGQLLGPVLKLLRLDSRVKDALPNLSLTGSSTVTDPYFYRQTNLRDMRVPEAWDAQPDATGIVVAILDTGLTAGPDLDGTPILPGYDFINSDGDPADDHQHGTMMASILAAAVGDSHGAAGVAPGVTILPVKVLNARKVGSTSALVEGMYFAAEQGARVINLSLSYAPSAYPGAVLDEALEEMKSQGILVFAATGNQGVSTVSYPAAHPSVVAVGASQPTVASEDAGRAAYGNYGTPLDLEVPGGAFEDVDGDGRNDAILAETFNPASPGDFAMWATAGTSGATAQASGVAALLLSAAATDSARVASVRRAMESTVQDVGAAGFDAERGAGRLDAASALEALLDGSALIPAPAYSTQVALREDLVLNISLTELGLWKKGVANVDVRDSLGRAAPNVWVYGHFVGASGSSRAIKTSSTGRATFTSSNYRTSYRLLNDLRFIVDRVEQTGASYASDTQTSWLSTPTGTLWLTLSEGLSWLLSSAGTQWLLSPAGMDWLTSSGGQAWMVTLAGQDWLISPAGQAWMVTLAGQDWLLSPAGSAWLASPDGQAWMVTLAGQDGGVRPAD